MNKNKIILTAILIFMCLTLGYLVLGNFGLLPKWFYTQCENVSLETAQLRGCCEDRTNAHPTSWFFGEDNCDKYRIIKMNQKINKTRGNQT